MDIKEIKKDFLSQYIMSSDKTKERLDKELDLFFEICNILNENDLTNFKSEDMYKFYNYSKEHKWSASTTNLRLQTIKLFFSWLVKKEIIKNNILEDVKSIRTVNEVHYTPEMEDCNKLLEYIKTHTKKRRLYLMTKILISSALRRSEVCNLKLEDLDKENCNIKVFGKGKKIVYQPLPSSLVIELVEYINTERQEVMNKYKELGGKDKGYIFVSGIGENCIKTKDLTNGNKVDDNVLYQQIKRYAKSSGMKNSQLISPHALRRASGTEIFNQTKDIKTASEFLRHANISTTTQCYINFNKQKVVDAVNNTFGESIEENKLSDDEEYQLFLLLKKKYAV